LAHDLIWNEGVFKDLEGLDQKTARSLVDSIKNRLAANPLKLGKPLKGIFQGLHRYRYGDNRIIYALDRADKKIIILHIRHRSETYRKK
jgi:mRNA interferase RelE/StbE